MSHAIAPPAPKRAGFFRRVLAAVLDLVLIVFAGGYAVAAATGGLTEGGFSLEGGPAFLLFAFIIAYFVVFPRFLGGTLFQRLFGIR